MRRSLKEITVLSPPRYPRNTVYRHAHHLQLPRYPQLPFSSLSYLSCYSCPFTFSQPLHSHPYIFWIFFLFISRMQLPRTFWLLIFGFLVSPFVVFTFTGSEFGTLVFAFFAYSYAVSHTSYGSSFTFHRICFFIHRRI